MVAGVYGVCAQMSERSQDFHNFSFLHIRNKLLLRQKLVWSLDHDREKVLRKTIVEHDNRWKKVKDTPAIKFDLKENWQNTLK